MPQFRNFKEKDELNIKFVLVKRGEEFYFEHLKPLKVVFE